MFSELSDEGLIEKYRQESSAESRETLINELFARHQKKVALWCLRLTSDRESALDLAQEVLVRAFERLDQYQGRSKFSTWLYSIARNHCLNYLQAKKPEVDEEAVLEQVEDRSFRKSLESIELRSYRDSVWKLVCETLNGTEMRAMVLHYAHDIPLPAVTRLLQLDNRSGAKAYIVSAKRKLAPALDRWAARNRRTTAPASGQGGPKNVW